MKCSRCKKNLEERFYILAYCRMIEHTYNTETVEEPEPLQYINAFCAMCVEEMKLDEPKEAKEKE